MRSKPFVPWFLFVSLYHLFQATIIHYLFITLHDCFVIFWYKPRGFVLPCCVPTAGLLAGKLRRGDRGGICQLCLSKCSVVTSAQPPRARSCSSGLARGGKGELARLGASTLEDRSSGMGVGTWCFSGCVGSCRGREGTKEGVNGAWRLVVVVGTWTTKRILWGEKLRTIKRSTQLKLLQDKGMERWLQPDADKLYGFTHAFPSLHWDK